MDKKTVNSDYIQKTTFQKLIIIWGSGSWHSYQQIYVTVSFNHTRPHSCFSHSRYQEEKNGFLQWTVWVNELLRWTTRPCPPPWLRSTTTQGICTSWTGLFLSLSAWVRFKICGGREVLISSTKAKASAHWYYFNYLLITTAFILSICAQQRQWCGVPAISTNMWRYVCLYIHIRIHKQTHKIRIK